MERIWIVSYAYLVYLFLATLPQLTNLPGFNLGIPILVLIATYFYHSYVKLGRRSVIFFVIGFSIGFLFEFLGVHTGFPFGRYYYTSGLGYEVLGVPIIIPFLWATLAYFSFLPSGNPFISSWIMVIIDLTVDPLFSKFDWHWITPGQYFGVPISNFVSWYFISLLIYVTWSRRVTLIYDPKASLFAYGLILDLALQDYFAGLGLPALISFGVASFSFLTLHVLARRLRYTKSVGEHKNN
ncbi:putative membrane protein [Metallosphaera sedula]|uniref:Membrane protein n=3 Tax=Metallosphaera TaxID=41980 RepID=A0A088E6X9_9CREN|nr:MULTISPECIES: carotenoid biosynthesis protein [Metallosphaera]ABP95518.1 putative membrane protein [Metallosphaera sedula DSM 5348]AIM27502.1 putative membrane protein [Metallosphaera sedula]AKV74371.1 membrane protein [Metallosphaera sedula]AKV76610.1 membrane protein [Metallosphaera sedula]AKV78862.1 membrane protein [Metallosphaera sedula]